MQSAIYTGRVKHTRYFHDLHQFNYALTMYYINLNELDQITQNHQFISNNKFNLLSFIRKSYLGHPSQSIESAVKQKLTEQGYKYEASNISLLTHLSYLGYCYNPVTFYFCFDSTGDNLQYILSEINNTPWNERHTYVLACDPKKTKHEFNFDKQFHISPFMPMNLNYKWYISNPSSKINIYMQTYKSDNLYFEANLLLDRIELSNKSIIKEFVKFPFMTQEVICKIYWQAFKLWFKRFTFYRHPGKINE